MLSAVFVIFYCVVGVDALLCVVVVVQRVEVRLDDLEGVVVVLRGVLPPSEGGGVLLLAGSVIFKV